MASNLPERVSFEPARGKHILIALSGGADSVALLMLMARAREKYAMYVTAAHLNHMIRGSDADGDQRFCEELCDRENVPLITEHIDVPRIARETDRGLETAARDARYGFLYECAKRAGADLIALAHHADDQAETVLMHLLRGAGSDGLSGMAERSGMLYRPLLNVRKRDLEAYLTGCGAVWREDATNKIADTPRNALRLNVMPEIEKSYPSAAEAICRCAKTIGIENDLLGRLTDQFLGTHLQRGAYGQRLVFSDFPEEAILRRALKRLLGQSAAAARIDAVANLCRARRGRTDIGGTRYALRTPNALYFLDRNRAPVEPALLNLCGATELPAFCRIYAECGEFEIDRTDPLREVLDADVLSGAAVRTRRDGDRFHPLGAPGDMLLSDFFTNRGVDLPVRDVTPLIAAGSRVFWVCGMMPSEEARITDTTRRRVRLTLNYIADDPAEV